MLSLTIASQNDIVKLRDLAIDAFSEDKIHRPESILHGDPPGLSNLEKHQGWLESSTYLKCTMNEKIVGSCILEFESDVGTLFGLHVGSQSMNKGIGSWVIAEIVRMYPLISLWSVQTPDYATRNHYFYRKNGFYLFEKTPIDPSVGLGFFKFIKRPNE